jgi:para-nitrobenzyl esterase
MRWFGTAMLTALTLAVRAPAGAEDLFANIKSGKPDIVKIGDGELQGYDADGVRINLGIPFAAPPVGDLRRKPPAATVAEVVQRPTSKRS